MPSSPRPTPVPTGRAAPRLLAMAATALLALPMARSATAQADAGAPSATSATSATPATPATPAPPARAATDASDGTRTLPAVRVTASSVNERPLGYLAAPSESGALGSRSVLDTPFSVTVVNSEDIVERGARSISQIFGNDAAVSSGTSSYTTDWWGTRIRGLPVRNSFIDGVPMMLYWGGDFPLELAETVTALKGLTGFMYGFGTPGGALSYELKRPKASDETLAYLGWGNPRVVSLRVDSSRMLSDDLGLRANVAIDRGTAYNDSRIDRTVASLGVDKHFRGAVTWFTTALYEKSRIEGEPLFFADMDAYDVSVNGNRLPDPTYRYRNISVGNSWYETETAMLATGVEWRIDDRWRLKTQLGASRRSHRSNKTFASILNRAGDYEGWLYNFAGKLDSQYTQAMLQGSLQTGPVRHDVVAGLGMQRSRDRYSNDFYYESEFTGNLYQPQPYRISRTPDFSLGQPSSDIRQLYGFASDTLRFGEHWQVIAGLRYTRYRSSDPSDAQSVDYTVNQTSPTLALIYKPDARTSFYGSFVQGLEPGTRVQPPYANAGAILGATVSKQIEIGAKHETGRLGYAAALFRVELANQMDRYVGTERFLTQDGKNVYQGLDLSTSWQVDPALRLGASAVYLDASVDKVSPENADLLGKTPANVPKWQAVVNAQYRVPGHDRLKLHGNVQYFGATWATPQNRLEIPSHTVFNAGFTYDFNVQGRDLTLIGNVYNLFNRKYWALSDWSRGNVGEGRNVSLAVLARF